MQPFRLPLTVLAILRAEVGVSLHLGHGPEVAQLGSDRLSSGEMPVQIRPSGPGHRRPAARRAPSSNSTVATCSLLQVHSRRSPRQGSARSQWMRDQPVVSKWINDSALSQAVWLISNLEHLAGSRCNRTRLRSIGIIDMQRDPDRCGADRLGARRAEVRRLRSNTDLPTFDQK